MCSFRKAAGSVAENCNLLKIALYHNCLLVNFPKVLDKLFFFYFFFFFFFCKEKYLELRLFGTLTEAV